MTLPALRVSHAKAVMVSLFTSLPSAMNLACSCWIHDSTSWLARPCYRFGVGISIVTVASAFHGNVFEFTYQWACQCIQASRECEIRIRQCGCNQVRGVGGGVSALVVGVDHQVQSHQLVEVWCVVS